MSGWLDAIESRRPNEEWAGVSWPVFFFWLAAYGIFLFYAVTAKENFLLPDYVNLAIHEAGHPLFGTFGYIIGILGGTLMELIVPLVCALYFWWSRHTTGVAFCSFWFFENFLYIGTYMADARRVSLPLVGSGEHDWEILFGYWGVLHLDQKIGGFTRALGWIGMLATVAWFIWRAATFRGALHNPKA